jgi:hypothetical protein
VSAILADLQATRAVQSSRTAFVLEAVMEKGLLGPLETELCEQGNPAAGLAQARHTQHTPARKRGAP